ncbi:hypothetical protein COU37_04670 [Candidatus Micrarchaeota archaeon CG10_big_fil_rev_8_21_14_0_10_45_29]|nr:MAG: hypothetical protein COU37_04670 [Candidatus Micrarchaeota archaeon CG10_big_fil_rev_8_21_14_0_10_45_29]
MEELAHITVLGDQSLLGGFKLAGVKSLHPVAGVGEFEKSLISLMNDKETGIIIVSEQLLEQADRRLKQRVEAAAKPVVIAVPGKDGPMERSESLAKLIKRALGFDIMKKK